MTAPSESRQPSGRQLAAVVEARLRRAGLGANALGVVVVTAFGFLLPTGGAPDGDALNLAAIGLYALAAFPTGLILSRRRSGVGAAWLLEDRPPSQAERDRALAAPRSMTTVSAGLWAGAAILFGVLNATASARLGLVVAAAVALGGVTTCAVLYLLGERILRPVTARALAAGPPAGPSAPGVAVRLTMAWALATGVPVLGIAVTALADVAGAELDRDTITWSVLLLAVVALAVGLLAIVVAARSVADPLAAVRAAAGKIEAGDLDARVAVDDGSEVGLLAAGFNRMAAQIAERERLRDLFGRHVGEDVARAALRDETALGGEVRELAVLFVDLIGSTRLASQRRPHEVVALLNAFFALVVEVAERHGGWVNKFDGDGALCVFGAPTPRERPAADALAAGRDLHARLHSELPEADAGIGVSAGEAVAGNVGAERRFEYTVIGDPVNEAARLCELAKRRPERLLASDAAVERAGDGAAGWQLGEAVELRGRSAPTRIATASSRRTS